MRLDNTMSGEAMVLNIANKINNNLKCFHRKNSFFDTSRHLLCNALIQPYFDYACSAWFTEKT